MVVALSDQRKIRFYRSSDLKHWTSLSDFGPAGATDGAWECPDFFSLPVDGSADESEFVLVANVGGGAPAGQSGTQYFIGNFDGTNFTPDPDSLCKSVTEFVVAGHVLEAFEGDSFGGRQGTGTAFGGGLANSFHNGDGSTGTLTSPPFQITNSYIDFLIGGGSQKETCMKLLVDGKVVRTASGVTNISHGILGMFLSLKPTRPGCKLLTMPLAVGSTSTCKRFSSRMYLRVLLSKPRSGWTMDPICTPRRPGMTSQRLTNGGFLLAGSIIGRMRSPAHAGVVPCPFPVKSVCAEPLKASAWCRTQFAK